MAETSIVSVTQYTTTEIRYDTVTTATAPTGRIVEGVHFYGTEGGTIIEGEDGTIPDGTGADDGAGTKTLPKGVRYGTVAHLGTVNFAEPYQGTPTIVYAGGGLSMEQRAKWGTRAAVDAGTASTAAPTSSGVYQEPIFDADPSGFTAYLYLRTSATLTDQTSALGSPTTLTSARETGVATPAAANLPAYNARYSCDFSGSMTAFTTGPASVLVALEARLDSGLWTGLGSVKKTHTFKVAGTWNFSGVLSGTISDFDGSGTDQFRCRIDGYTGPGPGLPNISVTFGPNIEWKSGSPSYASMTPGDGDEAAFVVIGGTSSA